MARLPRLYAPDVPQLVQARFARPLANAHDPTPSAALDLLREWLFAETRHQNVAVHGWAILPDRIVLLATPPQAHGISRVIQGLGRRMAPRITHGRVFEGRYRSTLVDDAWIPACLAWAESLPVRQGLVDTPQRWPWSSAQDHVGLRSDASQLTEHTAYWEMGNTPFARQARYQALLNAGTSSSEQSRIEQALFGQWALGNDTFRERLLSRGSRRAAPAPRGRPRKPAGDNTVTN
ncbi:hypothetical protein H0A73_02310 [Alcaligenaceae bacterium]|nr:hypothetical protein [Alcaligenaceae bacterium]